MNAAIRRHTALYIGLTVTALTAGAYLLGLLDGAESKVYDEYFRLVPQSQRVPDCQQIAHIDIDDGSLAEYGRWPWPREYLADIVRELTACQAKAIVLDIIMPEPQDPRLAASPLPKHYDLVGPSRTAQTLPDSYILDDEVLAGAIRQSGKVFVAMHFERDAALPQAALGQPGDSAPPPEDLLSREGQPWVQRRVERLLAEKPDVSADEVARAISPAAARDAGPVQDLIFNCFRRALAMRALDASSLPATSTVAAGPWQDATAAVPPIPKLVQAAAGAGFVYFETDPDGSMRSIPLLMRYRGRAYPQMAFLVACWLTGVPLDRIRIDHNHVVLPASMPDGGAGEAGTAEVRIPLDGRHRMLINWHGHSGQWQDSFPHVSARGVLDIAHNRRLILQKEGQINLAPARVVELAFDQDSPQRKEYQAACAFLGAQDQQRADLPAERFGEYLASATLQKATIEQQAADELRARVTEEVRNLERLVADKQNDLRSLLAGRVCFVGSTATGAADFVVTPVFSRCPGVVVHSNILNTIVTGRFIAPVPRWLNLLAVVVCGLLATGLTARFGPRVSMALVLGTMALIGSSNVLVVFGQLHHWLVLAAPLAGIAASAGSIMLYRWLTEARQRRWVTQMLGSYTSPAVARRVAEKLTLAGEQRVVTCMFTDLKSFTPISEQLGPERTVALLNRYLGRMSEVLQRHEAYINKFLGDGIFAIFGAPEVQIDHARRSAAAALDCREELRFLCRELADIDAPTLVMRIGIATGSAIVGDCGTSLKRDYTAVGDTVNLASRLESANKALGTSILVSAGTAAGLESHFLFRPLGRIVVVGKQQAVAVLELVDRLSECGDAERCWADAFAAAIDLYARRQFAQAGEAFESLQVTRPADRVTAMYLQLCRSAMRQPPGDDWIDAIVLTEK